MKNRILTDYLLELRAQLKHLPYAQQDAMLADVEAHLQAHIKDLKAEEPGLTEDEYLLRATAAFGAPAEIGFREGPKGGLVRKSTGEVLVRAAVLTGRAAAVTGRAAGRGARSILKWSSIVAGVLLAAGLVVLIVAAFVGTHVADTYHKEISESIPHEAFTYQGSWAMTDPHSDLVVRTFSIPDTAKEMRIEFQVNPGTGCGAIQLTSPSGKVYPINGNGCSRYGDTATYQETGTWQVQVTYAAFTGSASVHAVYFERAQ